jgi:predicted DNA-binding transcriptional regulator AlpA
MTYDEVMRALKERPAVSVDVAAKACGLCRASAYRAVHEGSIPSAKVGGRLIVPTAPLRRMLGLDHGEAA